MSLSSEITETIDNIVENVETPIVDQTHETINRLRSEIAKVLVGQKDIIDQVLTAFLASGHILLEGVPGLGKTLLIKALSECFNGDFARIQFTPDLMPADVMGHMLFDMHKQEFSVRKGPIFTNLLLADEINRAPAKTQSALLECMQEGQVTIEGTSHKLDKPFMVMATQNPIEQEGTYPLPEAQLDRFLMKVLIDYPTENEEFTLVRLCTDQQSTDSLNTSVIESIVTAETITELQEKAANIHIDDQVVNYAVQIVRSTREHDGISVGAGPRGAIGLVRAAKAHALLQNRNFVIPGDIKALVAPVLRHRISLSAEMQIEGRSTDDILNFIIEEIPAPRI